MTNSSKRLQNMEPAEDLQKIAAGENKSVTDTFALPANFSTTPVVTEDQRQTGEVKGASEKLRSGAPSGYPSDAK